MKEKIRNLLFGEIAFEESVKAILANNSITMYDVGAAAGIQSKWDRVRRVGNFVLFEPHEESYRSLVKQYSGYKNIQLVNLGLSDIDGIKTLSMTNVPTGTTILEFDESAEGFKYLRQEYIYPIKKININTSRLDSEIKSRSLTPPDMIKLDTQGSEPEIIDGLGEYQNELISVEMEVGLVRCYKDQKELWEVLRNFKNLQMFPLHFECIFSEPKNVYSLQFTDNFLRSKMKSKSRSRIWEFDIVFFKSEDILIKNRDHRSLRKLVLAYCIYEFYHEAVSLCLQMRDLNILPSDQVNIILDGVKLYFQSVRSKSKLEKIKQLLGKN